MLTRAFLRRLVEQDVFAAQRTVFEGRIEHR
jgi:hypothetical protein